MKDCITKREQRFSGKPIREILPFLFLLWVCGGIFIYVFRYQVSQDAICYIHVARAYLSGNFQDAVNGHWSPLLSWLMMGFLAFDIDPLAAGRIVNLGAGSLLLIFLHQTARRLGFSFHLRLILLGSAIPMIYLSSLPLILADPLLCCMILGYLSIVLREDYLDRVSIGLQAGFLGGIGYLAKAYALPFFLVHFTLMHILFFLRQQNREKRYRVVRNFFAGFFVFSMISIPWILTLSQKYGCVTYSRAGTYNLSLMGPESVGHPHRTLGFVPPSNPTAVSAADDRSLDGNPRWHPFQSIQAFRYYMSKLLGRNFRTALNLLQSYSHFSLALIAIALFMVLGNLKGLLAGRGSLSGWSFFYFLLAIVIYVSGYLPIFIMYYYLLPVFFMILLLGVYTLHWAEENFSINRLQKIVMGGLLAVSFALPAAYEFKHTVWQRDTFSYPAAETLKKYISEGSRYASNTNWPTSRKLGFFLNAHFYGIPEEGITQEKLRKDLAKYDIRFYFVWGDPTESVLPGADYQPLEIEGLGDLRVYALEPERQGTSQGFVFPASSLYGLL